MTYKYLLYQFLDEDCSDDFVKEIIAVINLYKGKDKIEDYTFNRFNLRINFLENEVTIEDDLNVEEDGATSLSLEKFKEELCKYSNYSNTQP